MPWIQHYTITYHYNIIFNSFSALKKPLCSTYSSPSNHFNSYSFKCLYLVQFSLSVVSHSLRPHESQHTRPSCPSPIPRVHSDSCPSSRWCHPAISSSVFPPSPPALSALSHASDLDWRSISHMVIYIFQYYSLKSSHPRLLLQSPKVCSLHLCLLCCLSYRVIVTIFLNSIYMRHYTVLVFFFLAYFTLYNRLQFHPPH